MQTARYSKAFRSSSRQLLRAVRYALPLVVSLTAVSASAQSAADKATARKLATEGIQAFQEGKYPEALDRLQRAEALYDAPVHLLYIARAQAKLNQLVEAAESYRRLVRVTLEPNAPTAFKDAVEAGKKELEALEPTVPALRIDVEPANVQGLELTIGTEKVPAAVVGAERPVNPGKTKVVASAPGYKAAQAEVDVKPGARESVRLVLAADPTAGAASTAPAATAGPAPVAPVTGPPPSEERSTKGIGFFVGLRFAGAVPAGDISQNFGMSDWFKAGGGAEIHGGIRFLRYFGAKLFVEGYTFKTGEALDNVPTYGTARQVDAESTASATGVGLGVIGGLLEREKFGVFGELGFVAQDFTITQEFTDRDLAGNPVCPAGSTDTATLSGSALRLGAGVNIPVARFLHLTPYAMVELGQFSSLDFDYGCPVRASREGAPLPGDHDIPKKSGHQLFLFGIGGDFIFGKGP